MSFPLPAPSLRPRLLVTTDIGGDPDDQQSMVRLLLHAEAFEIEGLVASASGTPGELEREVVRPDLIGELVEAYGMVRPALARHRAGYPEAAELGARIRAGNPRRGRGAIGVGHDTEGSRAIAACLQRDDPRPLGVAIWGGQTDLAQALWSIRAEGGESALETAVARLRVHDIHDQDGLWDWMLGEFPGLGAGYLLSSARPGEDKRLGAYRGMYLEGDVSLTSRAWIDGHVRTGHGPLGALYPPRTWTEPNPHGCLKEGDTPSWFHFLPHGLNDPAHPEWGGWGGRFARGGDGRWRDVADTPDGAGDRRTAVARWRPFFQAEFAARLDACVRGPAEANHAPRAVLQGDASAAVVRVPAVPGAEIVLDATGSADPDGHRLSYRWWHYAGVSAPGAVALAAPREPVTAVRLPSAARPGDAFHIVLEVADDGDPPLTTLRRAVLEIG